MTLGERVGFCFLTKLLQSYWRRSNVEAINVFPRQLGRLKYFAWYFFGPGLCFLIGKWARSFSNHLVFWPGPGGPGLLFVFACYLGEGRTIKWASCFVCCCLLCGQIFVRSSWAWLLFLHILGMWARLLLKKFLAKWEWAWVSLLFLLGILGQVRYGSADAEKHVSGCLDWFFTFTDSL